MSKLVNSSFLKYKMRTILTSSNWCGRIIWINYLWRVFQVMTVLFNVSVASSFSSFFSSLSSQLTVYTQSPLPSGEKQNPPPMPGPFPGQQSNFGKQSFWCSLQCDSRWNPILAPHPAQEEASTARGHSKRQAHGLDGNHLGWGIALLQAYLLFSTLLTYIFIWQLT